MGYEVDFFPAAAGQVAMAVRWGVQDNYKVLIYDGGTTGSGEQLVEHVAERFGTSRVDYAVSPRPARSAAGGLAVVLKKLQVGELWMHRLRSRSAPRDAPIERARGLERLALERGVPVHEPFEGAVIGPFTVLSPQRD